MKMDEGQIKGILENEIDNAIGYIETETTELRRKALDYYLRNPYGNEVEGRSQIVTGEVAEAIDGALPQLIRVFTTTEDIVYFEPTRPEDEESAKQATDYCNWVFYRENDGLLILHNWFKDALMQKVGVVKAYWEAKEDVNKEKYKNLTEDELAMLLSDPGIEVVEQEVEFMDGGMDMMGMPIQIPLYNVKVKKSKKYGCVKIENVPPEEFLISKSARTIQDSPFVAHRRLMTRSELIAMGFKKSVVEELPSYDDLQFTPERVARFSQGEQPDENISLDPAMQVIEVYECYIYIDVNGDGIAELRKILYAGSEILDDEECDLIPFHSLCPIPIPHKFFGQSLADRTMDIQLIKSTVTRQMLDNLYLTNNARLGVVDGQVNLDDALNATPGGIIRMKSPNAVQAIEVPAVTGQAFPMLEYMDAVQAKRTGVNDAQQGLDPDVLNNVSATAIAAMMKSNSGKLELIARIFAETGVKSLFRGILHLLGKYQDEAKIVRMRGKFVAFDPRTWANEYDVSVNVGLGSGDREQKLAMLNMVSQKQEQIIQAYGPSNPLVSVAQYRDTLARMIEAAGFKDASVFLNQISPEQNAALSQPQPPKPDAQAEVAQMLAQVEREKTQAKAQIDAAKLDLERQTLEAEFTRKGIELQMKQQNDAADMRLREAELAVKQLQAILAMDIADEDSRNKQADIVLKAIRELGNLTKGSNGQVFMG
jgi:hypothetical protein